MQWNNSITLKQLGPHHFQPSQKAAKVVQDKCRHQMIKGCLNEGLFARNFFVRQLTYELALTSVFGHFGFVCAHEKFAFEQLDSNDTEHEDQEQGHQDNVTDGLDGDDDALNDMFEAFGSVDGTERT